VLAGDLWELSGGGVKVAGGNALPGEGVSLKGNRTPDSPVSPHVRKEKKDVSS